MSIPFVVTKLCPGQEKRTDGQLDRCCPTGQVDKATTICSPFRSIKIRTFLYSERVKILIEKYNAKI
jgi:hypothetical protein